MQAQGSVPQRYQCSPWQLLILNQDVPVCRTPEATEAQQPEDGPVSHPLKDRLSGKQQAPMIVTAP